ncbi:MinD/ParA family ATP-binding protein [Halorussus halobius]|uniref:MinD/ParA family ATP-binding protein n=1 Tax=Halorussus halobius TaxID=1710537 RepID=UPI001092271E|nr:AAA family ATPase [Halorussus halobius]
MLAIAGGKGGCGKTTTTLGLAAALVRQRKAALAVDADPEMPDLHALAGVSRDPGVDAVAAGWPPGMVAGTAGPPAAGAAVLPAASDSRVGASSSPSLSARLGATRGTVLLDCPAGAGPDAVEPLRLADAAVVVTTPEPACLRDAAKTAAMARELDLPVAGAVVSRAEAPPAGVADLLDCEVLGVVPDVGAGASVAPLADERVRTAHDEVVSALQPKCL